jgi:tetratricopeptide (TPR) repeat protein
MTVGPDEESRLERGYFLSILAKCFYNIHGQFQPALEMVQEAEGILRQLGPKGLRALAQTLSDKTWILRFMGHLNAAEACCDECTRIFLDLGDEWSNVYWQMAESAKRQGNFELAKKYCVIERERGLEIDSYTSVANIDRMLANWERERGMYEEAKILYQNSLRTFDRMASMAGLSLALGGLASNQAGIAQILQEEKAHRTWMGAARILAGIKTAQEEYHLPTYHEDRQIYDEAYEKVKGALPAVDLERAWAEGRVMRLKEVVTYALNE